MARAMDWERASRRDAVAAGRREEYAERAHDHEVNGKPLIAVYAGTCAGCGRRFKPGANIRWRPADKAQVHAGCTMPAVDRGGRP